jgi:hypothetical protein
LHLQRDRKGVWRIFPSSATSATPVSAPATETEPSPVPTAEVVETRPEPVTEALAEPLAAPLEAGAPAFPALVEEPTAAEGSEARRPRRAHASKTGRRRSSSRRKPKELTSD